MAGLLTSPMITKGLLVCPGYTLQSWDMRHQFPSAWEGIQDRIWFSLLNSYIIIHSVDFGIISVPCYLQDFGFW